MKKEKRKQVAKFIIIIISSIYDPFYRHLIDEENDNNEKRIWCIVNYPSNLKIFNSIMNTIHFFIPFIINLISAIILITKKSHQQSNVKTNRTS